MTVTVLEEHREVFIVATHSVAQRSSRFFVMALLQQWAAVVGNQIRIAIPVTMGVQAEAVMEDMEVPLAVLLTPQGHSGGWHRLRYHIAWVRRWKHGSGNYAGWWRWRC